MAATRRSRHDLRHDRRHAHAQAGSGDELNAATRAKGNDIAVLHPLRLVPFDTELKDGWTAHVRQVAPEDRSAVAKGFESVSPQSRRLRYLSGHGVLTEAELDTITQSDGLHGFAIGAEMSRDDDDLQPAGIARYVRSEDDPAEAEVAITIADRFHGLGLGGVLLGALAEHSALNGIERWRSLVGRQNDVAIAMFKALGSHRAEPSNAQMDDISFITPLSTNPAIFPKTPTGDRIRDVYAMANFSRETS